MKKFLTLSFLLSSFIVFAQYAPFEIKKLRIAKLTKLATTKGGQAPQKNEIWYDEYGNDTAEYNDGQLYRRTKYEYDLAGYTTTRVRFGADGKETETAIYTHNSDGTCIIRNTDKNFGMTDITYCDKTGKIKKNILPDKTEIVHSYDARGRLRKIKSGVIESGAMVTDIQYSYNSKGQMIAETSNGDYKWNNIFMYDKRGLISKVKRNSVTDGVADPEVSYTYEYEFRK